ncbi:hypothetical protein [Amycolatopsis anabasis]|uniref:hypothetical protein n=1 Tax=Amycolatopsis anabasis TaxID=1840409 RepID=UPI00131DDE5F|nr:hypothetical protein [Amycolatopsis anabasis]
MAVTSAAERAAELLGDLDDGMDAGRARIANWLQNGPGGVIEVADVSMALLGAVRTMARAVGWSTEQTELVAVSFAPAVTVNVDRTVASQAAADAVRAALASDPDGAREALMRLGDGVETLGWITLTTAELVYELAHWCRAAGATKPAWIPAATRG